MSTQVETVVRDHFPAPFDMTKTPWYRDLVELAKRGRITLNELDELARIRVEQEKSTHDTACNESWAIAHKFSSKPRKYNDE